MEKYDYFSIDNYNGMEIKEEFIGENIISKSIDEFDSFILFLVMIF